MGIERYVRVESESTTRKMRVVDPATGAAIPGVCNMTIHIRDHDGKLLPVPKAVIELYCRVDVVAALEALPKEWPGKGAADGMPEEITNVRA